MMKQYVSSVLSWLRYFSLMVILNKYTGSRWIPTKSSARERERRSWMRNPGSEWMQNGVFDELLSRSRHCSHVGHKTYSLWRSDDMKQSTDIEHRWEVKWERKVPMFVLGWAGLCSDFTSVTHGAVWAIKGGVRKMGTGRICWKKWWEDADGWNLDSVCCWSEADSILRGVIGATAAALHPQHVEIYSTAILTVITQDLHTHTHNKVMNTRVPDHYSKQGICSLSLMEFVYRL